MFLLVAVLSTFNAVMGVKRLVDKAERLHDEKYDKDIFVYCLYRRNVVCPSCLHIQKVESVEEQFTTEWVCEFCQTEFEETPTHTIIKE
tara:strand:- start:10 stop:276 length:267 start_codon:yes stop_codon:yes gene_type:complete